MRSLPPVGAVVRHDSGSVGIVLAAFEHTPHGERSPKRFVRVGLPKWHARDVEFWPADEADRYTVPGDTRDAVLGEMIESRQPASAMAAALLHFWRADESTLAPELAQYLNACRLGPGAESVLGMRKKAADAVAIGGSLPQSAVWRVSAVKLEVGDAWAPEWLAKEADRIAGGNYSRGCRSRAERRMDAAGTLFAEVSGLPSRNYSERSFVVGAENMEFDFGTDGERSFVLTAQRDAWKAGHYAAVPSDRESFTIDPSKPGTVDDFFEAAATVAAGRLAAVALAAKVGADLVSRVLELSHDSEGELQWIARLVRDYPADVRARLETLWKLPAGALAVPPEPGM